MMGLLIIILVILLIAGMIVYAIQQYPFLPAPFNNVAIVIVILVAALAIANQAGLV